MRRQHLEGDHPVQARVARLVDFAHAARAEQAGDFVRTHTLADGQGHAGVGRIIREALRRCEV
jgi:hypothetical protein